MVEDWERMVRQKGDMVCMLTCECLATMTCLLLVAGWKVRKQVTVYGWKSKRRRLYLILTVQAERWVF